MCNYSQFKKIHTFPFLAVSVVIYTQPPSGPNSESWQLLPDTNSLRINKPKNMKTFSKTFSQKEQNPSRSKSLQCKKEHHQRLFLSKIAMKRGTQHLKRVDWILSNILKIQPNPKLQTVMLI